MNKFINYYGQELHDGDYMYNFGGYGIVQIDKIVSPDKAQGNKEGTFRIWFWCGRIDEFDNGTYEKHIRGVKGNDNSHLYKVQPNDEIDRMFSLWPTGEEHKNYKEFNELQEKYQKIYDEKLVNAVNGIKRRQNK